MRPRRRPVWALIGVVLLWLSVSLAQGQVCQGMTVALVPAGYQALTVSNTAATLTLPNGAAYAVISVETAAIRYRVDNTAPTANEGHPVASGGELSICGGDALRQFKAIRSTGSNATLRISYFKGR